MWRQWGSSAGYGCDPVYNRRIYAAQSHFDSHLLHDDFARTLDPEEALLMCAARPPRPRASNPTLHGTPLTVHTPTLGPHAARYVPVFLNQRVTWGADLQRTMGAALEHIRTAYPCALRLARPPAHTRVTRMDPPLAIGRYWNASGGRDHVWFIFGERQTCLVPQAISDTSIIVGHWGDADCVDAAKDVIVPTITPIQHDLPRFTKRLQPAMRASAANNFERHGPLLLFAGGITAFGASQDNLRASGGTRVDRYRACLAACCLPRPIMLRRRAQPTPPTSSKSGCVASPPTDARGPM